MESKSKEEQFTSVANMLGMEVTQEDLQLAKMTDEQINDMSNVLADAKPEILKDRLNFDSEEYNEYMEKFQNGKLQKGIATVTTNPTSGASMITSTTDIVDNHVDEHIDLVKLFDTQKDEITLDMCQSTFVDIYNLTNKDDQQKLFDAIMDVDNSNYDDLPNAIKSIIVTAVGEDKLTDKDTINKFTKYLLNNIKTDIITNKSVLDINTEVEKYHRESDKIMDDVIEYNREILEYELLKQAQEMEDKGIKGNSKQLRKCANSFHNSYTYEPLRGQWKSLTINGRKVGIKKYLESEVKNIDSYTMRFDNRYRTTQLCINSSTLLLPTLKRLLPNEDECNLKKFVILFCMYSMLLKPKKWEDHIFMYYTIQNIISLDVVKDKSTGFANEIITNVQKLIDDVIK